MKTKTQTKLLSIVLVLTMLVGMLTVIPFTVSAAALSGSGTQSDPILITSVADWNTFAENVSTYATSYVKVTAAELDFGGTAPKQVVKFKGTLDGNGVVIKNAVMSGKADVGLICTSSGTYKNFVITNSSFTVTDQWVGALLCCTNNTTHIENVYVTDSVSVTSSEYGNGKNAYAGCLLGGFGSKSTTYTVSFKDCVVDGHVYATSGARYCGLVFGGTQGAAHSAVIENCMATGRNTGKSPSSGFIGYAETSAVTFTNCIYAGGAESDYFASYPFAQKVANISVNNCYTTYVCKGDGVYKNGDGTEIKYTDANSGVTFINKDEPLAEDGKHFADSAFNSRGALIGLDATVTVEGFTKRENDIMVPNGLASFAPQSPFYIAPDAPTELRGEGTEASPYLLANDTEYLLFAQLASANSNYSGKFIKLEADIDFKGVTVPKLEGFAGTLDGNGKALKNINMSGTGDVALFCSPADNATFKNLIIKSSTFELTGGGNWHGTICCCTNAKNVTFSNIYVDKDVKIISKTTHDNSIVGGICGGVYGDNSAVVTIENCIFAGTLTATGKYAGGILGTVEQKKGKPANTVTVKNCLNMGDVSSAKDFVAGVVVAEGVTVENCVNIGTVSGANYVAGVYAGNPKYTTTSVSGCYSVNSIYDHNTSGGGTFTTENNTLVTINQLIGNNATVPATFTKRAGDIAVPAGCTVAPANIFGINMVSGAAVRMANPTGLRFTAMLGADYLNALVGDATDYSFGIIIAPTDYVAEANGVFTVEALKALSYTVSYKEIKAEKLQNDPSADGCYVFTGTLVNVQEANYNRDFSAIAYVKVGDTYYYSNYNEADNARNIAEVASNACADTSAEQNEVYQYAVTEGETVVYSPYTEEQRKVLADFFQ